jgi:hypothetical protein
LQNRLRIEREALRAPFRRGRIERFGRGDVLCDIGSVRADIGVTGAADGGVGVVSFLHHGAEEAREFGDWPREDRSAEIDIAEQAIQGIRKLAIRRVAKKPLGHLRKMRRRGHGEIFLALEVMKERTLRETGRAADIVHRARRVALGADHLHRRVQQAGARVRLGLAGDCFHIRFIPTSWYARQAVSFRRIRRDPTLSVSPYPPSNVARSCVAQLQAASIPVFAVKAAVTIYEAVLIGHTFDPGIAKPERERLGRHS